MGRRTLLLIASILVAAVGTAGSMSAPAPHRPSRFDVDAEVDPGRTGVLGDHSNLDRLGML